MEAPHRAGPEDGWQESDCYWFYDQAAGVGGYHRIGMRPNRGTAQVMLMVFALGGERFTRNDSFVNDRLITAADVIEQIMATPEPFSGSANSWASIGTSTPKIGVTAYVPKSDW